MGPFDRLRGTSRPAPGVQPCSATEMYAALLRANKPEQPFLVRAGWPEGVDLVVEWRVTDPRWFDHFAGATKLTSTLLRLDSAKCQVRAVDQHWVVSWTDDTPRLTLAKGMRRRWFPSVFARPASGVGAGNRSPSRPVNQPKPQLRQIVTRRGWTWRSSLLGRL